jgi:hypothetical protein
VSGKRDAQKKQSPFRLPNWRQVKHELFDADTPPLYLPSVPALRHGSLLCSCQHPLHDAGANANLAADPACRRSPPNGYRVGKAADGRRTFGALERREK